MEALLLAAVAAVLVVVNQRAKAPTAAPAGAGAPPTPPTPAPSPSTTTTTPAPAPAPPPQPARSTPDPITGESVAAPWPVWQGTASLRATLTPDLLVRYDGYILYLSQYAPSGWRLNQQASLDAGMAALLAAAAAATPSPPAPTPYHSSYPFAGRTRGSRGAGDPYDGFWNSVPVLRSPGDEANQSNVAMRLAWMAQVWITGPKISGPSVPGVPYSDIYFPVQGGGYIRMSDLSIAPS